MTTRTSLPGSPLSRRNFLTAAAGAAGAVLGVPGLLTADEKPQDLKQRVEDGVTKGLEWLKKTQAANGHWEADGGPPDDDDRARGHELPHGGQQPEGREVLGTDSQGRGLVHRAGRSSRTA